MNISAPFVYRPIATTLLALGLAIAGIVAFNLLPVAPLPQIEFPTINVQAQLPGGSPEVMATAVATPLERQLGRIAGITDMTSTSNLGSAQVTVQFDLSRDIDGAARDVQAAINAATAQLPTNLPSLPNYRKINPADAPILILSLTSAIYSSGQMYDIASNLLQQKLSQIEGVGQVFVGGSSLPAVRVELNPTVLNKYGISLTQVKMMLASANTNFAKGQLLQGNSASEIVTSDQLLHAAQYRPLIVAYHNQNPVRLADLGEVIDSVENIRNAGLSNGIPSVVLIIFKQPGANVIKTVDNVRRMLPQLQAAIPTTIKTQIAMDRTTSIRAALRDVEFTLIVAMLLVIFVTYLFLGSVRAMIIPGIAVPLSLLGTFGVMRLLNYSLDNLSLLALTISTGFVVDDAVVVLENVARHLDQGTKPLRAALQGAREVSFTVISMSLSLIAVFTPILLMSGIVGRLFREFAVTLSIAILISLIISLTVTPMMCAQLLKSSAHKETKKIMWLRHAYHRSLKWSLDHQKIMLTLTLLTLVVTIFLFNVIPKGFFPQQDSGRLMGSIQGDQNISFQDMKKKLTELVGLVHADKAVENVEGYVGSGTTNSGFMFVSLKPLNERTDSADAVIARLRKQTATVPGATLYLQTAQDLVVGGRLGNAQFQYTLSADTLDDLNHWTPKILATVSKLPGIADVNSDQLTHGLQVFVTVDHDRAASLGITQQQIDNTLYAAFGQNQVSTMYQALNQYHVVMEVAPPYWQQPETLNDIYITPTNGTPIPLATIAHFAPSTTLLSVNHQGQAPAATLSFNLLPNMALGDAVKEVENAVAKMHLPMTVHGAFQGTAQAFQASLANEFYLVLAALLSVYVVLGILYENLLHPVTILSTLPSAGVGALLALLITRTDLSIIALIGIILLIGIVKKNAIMMIDFALQAERAEKKSAADAIFEAAQLRLRPILMTTLAAMLGALPLALGWGAGSELRRPLGIAIIGGLLVSQILTLYTTPVIYLLLEHSRLWFRHRLNLRGV